MPLLIEKRLFILSGKMLELVILFALSRCLPVECIDIDDRLVVSWSWLVGSKLPGYVYVASMVSRLPLATQSKAPGLTSFGSRDIFPVGVT